MLHTFIKRGGGQRPFINFIKIIPSQMEEAPLHCTVDNTQKRRLFKNTKDTEKM